MDSLFAEEIVERPMRPYQVDAMDALRESLKTGHRRPLLMAPTGAGKTKVAAEIIKSARQRGKRVLFTIPALSLLDQTLKAFYHEGVRDIGIIQAQNAMTDWSLPVQIATVQTLQNRGLPECDIVIVDEAHVQFKFMQECMVSEKYLRVPFIGLSATPFSKGLGNYFDDLIPLTTTQKLIDDGYLCPFRVFAPAHPDLKGVRTTAGDYNEKDLSKAMDKNELVADVVETWIRLGNGEPTLVYGVDCAHAMHLHERFLSAGVRSAYIDAHTEIADRAIISSKFKTGEIQVICNIATMIIGVDLDVRCIVFARPTKSPALFVQVIGRGLRTAEGKSVLTVLDHADNHRRLGFVTDIHCSHLDDGRATDKKAAEKKEALPKECPKCAYLRPAKVSVCPNCGFEPKAQTNVQEVDGELHELTKGKVNKKLERKGFIKFQDKFFPLGEFFGQLRRQERERGYKSGWAANQYREAVGVWPNYYRDAPEMPISYEVQTWIRSRQIRYIKGKQKAEASQRA